MNASLIDSLGWTLLHFLWQGALVGCATAVALTVLRNAGPRQRYAVACTGLLACLLWPAYELTVRLRDGGAVLSPMRYADAMLRKGAGGGDGGWLALLQAHLLWVVAFWALCALVLSVRMALGLLWIQRARAAPPASTEWQQRIGAMARQFGIRREVDLRVVNDLASPLTAGWWRPVILVPAALMTGMPPELLEALLAHEMAHIRRLDYVVNLAQNVIENLLFYHPAVWWLSRRVRVEREQIADDLAAAHLGAPRRLATALSELERMQFSGHHLALAANGGDLLARVTRLLRPDRQAISWTALLPALALVAASAVAQNADLAPGPESAPVRQPAMAIFNSCARPVWPESSLAAQHSGTVTLGFQIGTDGKVIDSRVKRSSGHPLLDEAARVGIAKCRFKPASEDGKPVTDWAAMQYVWVPSKTAPEREAAQE